MRKLAVALALIAASFALVASTAEAAKTSEKEGRKFSRKYMKKESRDLGLGSDWVQRECYRIGRHGVGRHGVAPRGVACMFSNIEDGGDRCYLSAVGVKDTKRFISAELVTPTLPYHRMGDPADCQPDGPRIEWPHYYWNGVVGDPLRPIASAPLLAPNLAKRPPCEKRVDGVLRTIGFSGRLGRLNISCNAAKRIMTRYILHKKLPGQWYCSHLKGSFGKCVDEAELNSPECAGHEQRCVSSFNYMPGQRA